MNGITKETFQEADIPTRLDILFDYQKDTHRIMGEINESLQEHPSNCDARFTKLEGDKMKNTAISSSLGFMGGFVAMAAKLKFWG